MQDPQQPSTPSKKKDDAPVEPDANASDASVTDKPTAYSDEVGKPAEQDEAPKADTSPADEAPAVPIEDEKLLPAEASEDKPEPEEAPSVLADNTPETTEPTPDVSNAELPTLEPEEPAATDDITAAAPTATNTEASKPAAAQSDAAKPVSISINTPKPETSKPASVPEQSAAQMAQNAFQPDNPSGVVGVAGGMISTKPKKSRAKTIALILALLIILGGGAGAYYWWNKNKDADKTTSKNNTPTTSTTTGTCSDPVKAGGTAYSQTGGAITKANQAYTATTADVSAVKVSNSGTLTLANPTIVKSGDTSSSDNSSFTGQNAGVLATGASKVAITCGTINTTGAGANGVFSYGAGSSATLANLVIKASGQYSHGAMAAGGGTLSLKDVIIGTTGANSAPIATDKGGGTITVENGTATSTGTDSPGIYSTGTITVANATITATNSEAAVVEGSNKIELTGSTLSGGKKSGVMILQSTSGDAQGSTGIFTMSGGKLTAADGPLFYVTNTTGVISLKNVGLTATSGILLKASADQWGTSGKNGGTVTLSADSQTLVGNVVTDNLSTAALILKNNSSLKGSVNKAALTLDASSSWNVTADSTITTLSGATVSGTSVSNITGNGHTVYYSKQLNASLNGQTYDLAGGGKLMPQ